MEALPADSPTPGTVTRLLRQMSRGDPSAAGRLWPLVYPELRALAAAILRHERPDPVLQPTVVVHEAYLRLVGETRVNWSNRAHFHRVAARAMRRILIEWARRARQQKRGGGRARVPLDESAIGAEPTEADLLGLGEALSRLYALNSRWATVVELRFLSGMTCQEAADTLGVSVRTVEGDWQYARTWLHRELTRES